ncbi:MAG: NYN domain-containing protein [Spirochaetaceae bacterium]
MKEKLDNIAIFWDVENVTPSTDSDFVHGLLDYVSEMGKLTLATAFADWTKSQVSKTTEILADKSFEMIHVPNAKKNSSDHKLVSNAIEVLFLYPHITKFIIVTGDVDFRHLLITLRKHGKEIVIICDSQSASEDLLQLADTYKDYRDLIPDDYDNNNEEDSLGQDNSDNVKLTYDIAAENVRESVAMLLQKNKKPLLGAVKVRVKLLNENFNEKDLNHKTWKSLIIELTKRYSDIKLISEDKGHIIQIGKNVETIPVIFKLVIKHLNSLLAKSNKDCVNFSLLAQKLKDNKINIGSYGYSKIKKLVEAAEKRGLVKIKGQNVSKK